MSSILQATLPAHWRADTVAPDDVTSTRGHCSCLGYFGSVFAVLGREDASSIFVHVNCIALNYRPLQFHLQHMNRIPAIFRSKKS